MLRPALFPAFPRVAAFFALGLVDELFVRYFAPIPEVWTIWPVIALTHSVIKIALLSTLVFSILAWPNRSPILFELFRPSEKGYGYYASLASLNIVSLVAAAVARAHLAADMENGGILAFVYSAFLLAAFISLLLVAAPPQFWRYLWQNRRFELTSAIVFGAIGFAAAEVLRRGPGDLVSEDTWGKLSDATMTLSFWILRLFDSHAFLDPSTRVLGAHDFSVQIFSACSGYEGILLISAFLIGYMLVFRRSLKFPNALLLFPVAIGTIWLLNGLRIALLVFIGANFSEKIALDGFHSQFGWICFLLVAVTFMAVSQRMAFFRSEVQPAGSHSGFSEDRVGAKVDPVLLYLAPFIASLTAQILTNAAAPHEQPLYPLKVIAIGATLYAFRGSYMRLWTQPALSSLVLGALAGVVWIATDPHSSAVTPLQTWILESSPLVITVWLALRAIGTIVMVPIAEELAFRGYLYRALLAKRFEDVDLRAFSAVALIVSSALFGLMHDRWLAAALAGLLYALIMIWRGRISDAIAAHMTTNAVIFLWAVAVGQWSLL